MLVGVGGVGIGVGVVRKEVLEVMTMRNSLWENFFVAVIPFEKLGRVPEKLCGEKHVGRENITKG